MEYTVAKHWLDIAHVPGDLPQPVIRGNFEDSAEQFCAHSRYQLFPTGDITIVEAESIGELTARFGLHALNLQGPSLRKTPLTVYVSEFVDVKSLGKKFLAGDDEIYCYVIETQVAYAAA